MEINLFLDTDYYLDSPDVMLGALGRIVSWDKKSLIEFNKKIREIEKNYRVKYRTYQDINVYYSETLIVHELFEFDIGLSYQKTTGFGKPKMYFTPIQFRYRNKDDNLIIIDCCQADNPYQLFYDNCVKDYIKLKEREFSFDRFNGEVEEFIDDFCLI